MEDSVREGAVDEILQFFDIRQMPALRSLNPEEFFVAFWRGVLWAMADLHEILKQTDVRVVGHVLEGRYTAHVVSVLRLAMQNQEASSG